MSEIVKKNPHRWWALLGLSLFIFISQVDITIVSISLPVIQKSLKATSTQLQWLLNIIFLGLCAFMAIMGRLGDLYGLRRVLYINGILFAIASLGAGLSLNIQWLLFFRTVQGITLAVIPVAAALVSHNFLDDEFAKAMGIFSAVFGFGLALGPVAGGLIVDTISWRWIFLINIPVILIGLLLCGRFLQERSRDTNQEPFDWKGALFFVVGMVSLILSIYQEQLFLFLLSLVSLTVFVWIEMYMTQFPLIQFHLLGNRIFVPAALTCMIFGASMSTFLFLDPLYLQSILNYSATISGFFMLTVAVLTILFPPVAGLITKEFGAKTATVIVLLFTALSAFFHAYFSLSTSVWFIILALLFFGLAWGSVNVGPVVGVTNSTEKDKSGMILGALWTFFNVGSSLGLAIFGVLFRYRENLVLGQQITMYNLNLTPQQQHLIKSLMSDPDKLSSFLQLFPGNLVKLIVLFFKISFMYGFHSVMWAMFIIAIIGLIIVVLFMKQIPKSHLEQSHHS